MAFNKKKMTEEQRLKSGQDLYDFALGYLNPSKPPISPSYDSLKKKALKTIDESLGYVREEDKIYPRIIATKAQIFSDLGQFENAIENFKISLRTMDKADTKLPFVHLFYSIALLNVGDLDESDIQVNKAIEIMPEGRLKDKYLKKYHKLKASLTEADSSETSSMSSSSDEGLSSRDESDLNSMDQFSRKKINFKDIASKLKSLVVHSKAEYSLIGNSFAEDGMETKLLAEDAFHPPAVESQC